MNVELIYDGGCPNVGAAREQLLRAFAASGLVPRWREWERAAADAPPHVRQVGSPTILVNGRDVAAGGAQDGAGACRVYFDAAGRFLAAPSMDQIVAALKGGATTDDPPEAPPRTEPS